MKQTASFISTYAGDWAGVCSSLYELGGMTVMHDPSGCNSTYNTHDEPRWYDINSMVYISALTEIDAIMGNDDKLIDDIIYTANELHPKFIAIAGTPIPMMIGTDFNAIASIVREETNIPTFGFKTNGMHSYTLGALDALEAIGKEFVDKNVSKSLKNSVNILGATPLDFSVNKSVESMKKLLKENDFNVISTWAMGSSLDEMKKASCASVNLVVSYSGMKIAKYLYEEFNIPYVISTPYGEKFSKKVIKDLQKAEDTKENIISYDFRDFKEDAEVIIIGEGVTSESLAASITLNKNKSVRVLSGVECDEKLLLKGDKVTLDEDDIIPCLNKSQIIIADPLYKPICPDDCKFISLPHEGFSGRMFRKEIPNLIGKEL